MVVVIVAAFVVFVLVVVMAGINENGRGHRLCFVVVVIVVAVLFGVLYNIEAGGINNTSNCCHVLWHFDLPVVVCVSCFVALIFGVL